MINELTTVRLEAGCSLSLRMLPPGPDAVPFGDVEAGDRHRPRVGEVDVDDPFFGALGDGDLAGPGPLDVDGVFDLQPFAAERDRPGEAAGEVDRVGAGARVGGEDLAAQAAVAGDAGVAEVGDREGLRRLGRPGHGDGDERGRCRQEADPNGKSVHGRKVVLLVDGPPDPPRNNQTKRVRWAREYELPA